MAKKKTNVVELILSLIAIVLGALLIIPMFVSAIEYMLLGEVVSSFTIFTLGDMLAAVASEEVASLATATEVVSIIAISIIAIICGLVMAVLELLKLIGIRFPRFLRMLASVATVLLSIVAFIMLICLVAKANPDVENLDRVAHYALGAGSILILVFGVVGGAAGAIASKKA